MIVYRLTQAGYAGDLQGMGAFLAGGRWNSKGRHALYCAQSRALALCELLAHLPRMSLSERTFAITVIEFPDDGLAPQPLLPHAWRSVPHPAATRTIGDAFLERREMMALQLPSAIVPQEYIHLLNPHHPRRKEIKVLEIEPFAMDERLFQGI
jgi:RES domain-containing protein